MTNQLTLAQMPQPQSPSQPAPTLPADARVRRPVRDQVELVPRDLESLVPADHPARAIWALLERLDLSAFYGSIKAVTGRAGRPASDPQVLLGLWLLATVQGVASARELARLCEQHDVYRWLRGGVPVNYHQLAAFRAHRTAELDELLTSLIATLLEQELVQLERVAQDGVRVRASAGTRSFRGSKGTERALKTAREQVAALAAEREQPDPQRSRREAAARERAVREREERVARAAAQLPVLEAMKERQRKRRGGKGAQKVSEPKVSTTDPEARIMRMADGGFRPAYNIQFATDHKSGVIVGVEVSNQGSDGGLALPMADQVTGRSSHHPENYLVDGGYVDREQFTELEQRGIRVYAPLRPREAGSKGPRRGDSPEIIRWRERMQTQEAQAIYRQRGASAEWVNAQARGRYGVQQLLVRGITKVTSAMLLVAIAHNLMRWDALMA